MTLVEKENIKSIIPQRDPIIMIDTLEEQKEELTRCTLEVREDNLFVKKGAFQAPGLIENIAQSAAGRAGYHYLTNNIEPPIGFIGAVSKFKVHRKPLVGEVIETHIIPKSEVFNITLIKGESYVKGELVAECEMKIVIQEEEQ